VTGALALQVVTRIEHSVVRLSGDITLAAVPQLRQVVGDALLDRGTAIVDLAGVGGIEPVCLTAFPAELAAQGGWPWAKLALVAVPAEAATQLDRSRIPDLVPHFPDLDAALAGIQVRPPKVQRVAAVDPAVTAPKLARSLVEECCLAWSVPAPARQKAVLLVSELVTNAVQHAGTPITVAARCTRTALVVSVRDLIWTDLAAPEHRRRGRGLLLVHTLADHWGVIEHVDGKIVWARIRLVPRRGRKLPVTGDGQAGRGGGGYEIRTREGVNPTRFPSVRPRPLGESSEEKDTEAGLPSTSG
jgi:anti-anti-sigma regulatory factor